MTGRHMEQFCFLDETCKATVEKIIDKLGLSARAYTRIVKIAWTIADLGGEPFIRPPHLMEAAGYRFLDRRNLLEL